MTNGRRHRFALSAGYRLHWYEIESVLGQGGFGITYLARDTNLDSRVAIKEFLPTELAVRTHDCEVHPLSKGHSDTYGWGLNRFMLEARTLAKFKHPNIVSVFSVFEANNTAYMVMAYEEGRSLEDAFKFRRVQTETEYLTILRAILDGLELIHEAGFIHRDIKPQNIFLRRDGTPVLLDFGSARQAMGVQTRTLTTLVSPGYAPFEQYQSAKDRDRQGPWTDIYSVAATFYRGVAGAGPVDALARVNAIVEGRSDPLMPAMVLGQGRFSPSFLAALDAALRFQPAERPQSIGEWRRLLRSDALPATRPATLADGGSGEGGARSVKKAEEELADSGTTVRIGARRPAPGLDAAVPSSPAGRRARPALLAVAGLVFAAALGLYLLRTPNPAPPNEIVAAARPEAGGAVIAADGNADVAAKLEEAGRAEEVRQRKAAAEQAAKLAEAERQRTAEAAQAEKERQARAVEEARRAEEARQREAAAVAKLEEVERQRAAEATRLAEAERARVAAEEAARLEESRMQTAEQDRQRMIEGLLGEAREDLQAMRLTSPAGRNAFERYRQVLEFEPRHAEAENGLTAIVSRYLELAGQAADQGNSEKSLQLLARAESVIPGAPAIGAARDALLARTAAVEAKPPESLTSAAPVAGLVTDTGVMPVESAAAVAPAGSAEVTASAAPPAPPVPTTAPKEKPLFQPPFETAVFPFAVKGRGSGESDLSGFATRLFIDDSRFSHSYDYYHTLGFSGSGRAMTRQPDGAMTLDYRFGDKAFKAWTGTVTERHPDEGRVLELGRSLDVDLVLTYFIDGRSSGNFDATAYLFDIRLRKTYRKQGNQGNVENLTREMIRDFLAARRTAAGGS